MNNIDILEEKEKKAINNLNFIVVTDIYGNEVSIDKTKIINEYNESVGIVLNLVKTLIAENKELKEKNKWKPIKEYNGQKYDWVLVKYFDGNYECVPEVAEQRNDGKWYTSEKQIPFEVKYFFDMQSLLRKE